MRTVKLTILEKTVSRERPRNWVYESCKFYYDVFALLMCDPYKYVRLEIRCEGEDTITC